MNKRMKRGGGGKKHEGVILCKEIIIIFMCVDHSDIRFRDKTILFKIKSHQESVR